MEIKLSLLKEDNNKFAFKSDKLNKIQNYKKFKNHYNFCLEIQKE